MSETGEQWRPVAGFEDYYEVSDLGRVRSLPRIVRSYETKVRVRRISRRLPPALPYQTVVLTGEHEKVNAYVHTLVLEAFVGPRPRGHQARHLNGKAGDDRLVNLQWGTPTENNADMDAHGTRSIGVRRYNARLSEADVQSIRAGKSAGRSYTAIANAYGVSRNAIYQIIKGKTWTHV
jgi:hypothetical protein